MRNKRVSVNVVNNVSGLLEAAIDESYEQSRITGNTMWVGLAEQVRKLTTAATQLDGGPKAPIPRGRSVNRKKS